MHNPYHTQSPIDTWQMFNLETTSHRQVVGRVKRYRLHYICDIPLSQAWHLKLKCQSAQSYEAIADISKANKKAIEPHPSYINSHPDDDCDIFFAILRHFLFMTVNVSVSTLYVNISVTKAGYEQAIL